MAGSSARSAGAGSTRTWPPSPPVPAATTSADQVEDEVVLRTPGARLELQGAADVRVGAGAAGDRQHAVACVVERALDGDLPLCEERREVALPRLAHDEPHAVALVAPDLRHVALVEDVVREREDVPDGVSR